MDKQEQATNTIMSCMEKNDDIVIKLRESITGPEQLALLDQIKTEDEKLLKGPALNGEGMAQDQIDKLFD